MAAETSCLLAVTNADPQLVLRQALRPTQMLARFSLFLLEQGDICKDSKKGFDVVRQQMVAAGLGVGRERG